MWRDWSTLKKLIWLRFLRAASFIIKTVTGTAPLVLENAIAAAIKSLKQYGKVEQRNLPRGYTQVEYIASDATDGYVDTGIVINSVDITVEVDYQFTATPETPPAMVWGYMFGGSNIPRWGFGAYSGKWLGSVNQTAAAGSFDTGRHVAVMRVYMDGENPMWSGTLDGVALYSENALTNLIPFTDNTEAFYLFARNNKGTAGNFAPVKIYAFKVRKAGVLVNNFVPCKSGNTVGFFDTVTDTFLSGRGTLTAGPDVTTPTPDAPVDILCNNGALRFGWHDIITTSKLSGYGTYVSPAQAAQTRAYRWFKDLPNGTYQFAVDGDYEIIVQWRDPADPADGGVRSYENLSEWMTSGEVTLNKSTGGYGIAVRRTSGTGSITPSNFDGVLHVQEKGIYADGTPEVLTVTGKNLYDAATKILGYYIAADGTITSESNSAYSALIQVSPNTTYVLSGYTASNRSNKRIHAYDGNGNWISQINYVSVAGPKAYSVSGTTPVNCRYVRVSIIGSDTNVQFELGSTANDYQPYTAQTVTDIPMLLSVGDYADEAEIISGLLTHKVGVKVLDGTETGWTQATTTTGVLRFYLPFDGAATPTGAREQVASTHFSYAAEGQDLGISFLSAQTRVYFIPYDQTMTGTTWKAWLGAQYAAGTPVIVLYPLATEITESGTEQPLTTSVGTNTVSVTSNVDPVELEIEYSASA